MAQSSISHTVVNIGLFEVEQLAIFEDQAHVSSKLKGAVYRV